MINGIRTIGWVGKIENTCGIESELGNHVLEVECKPTIGLDNRIGIWITGSYWINERYY